MHPSPPFPAVTRATRASTKSLACGQSHCLMIRRINLTIFIFVLYLIGWLFLLTTEGEWGSIESFLILWDIITEMKKVWIMFYSASKELQTQLHDRCSLVDGATSTWTESTGRRKVEAIQNSVMISLTYWNFLNHSLLGVTVFRGSDFQKFFFYHLLSQSQMNGTACSIHLQSSTI